MDAKLEPERLVSEPPIDPSDPYEREGQTFPRLTPDQIARAAEFGVEETVPEDAMLFERGQRSIDFFIIIDGAVEIFDRDDACEPSVIHVHLAGGVHRRGQTSSTRAKPSSARGASRKSRVVRIKNADFRRMAITESDIRPR